MIRELQSAHYRPPAFSSYNGIHIPFVYPPLGLYVAALLSGAFHTSALDLMRWIPLLVNTATIVAFFFLARSLLSNKLAVLVSTVAYALIPYSFLWSIMGGGITRSFGLFFAMLAAWQLHLLYTRGARRFLLAAGAAAGLAILSHPEFVTFLAITAVAFFFAYSFAYPGGWTRVARSAGAAAIALLTISPWLIWVAWHHELAALLRAAGSGDGPARSLVLTLAGNLSGEPFFPLFTALALLGLLACLWSRRWLLPCWFLALYCSDYRGATIYGSVVMALLVGVSVADVLLPLLTRAVALPAAPKSGATGTPPGAPASSPARAALPAAILGILICYAIISAFLLPAAYLDPVPRDQRLAMQWVAASTPPSSTFLVIGAEGTDGAPAWPWAADRTAEWFPALASRVSVATYEGSEWLGEYPRRMTEYAALLGCARRDADCLTAWSRRSGRSFSDVYIAKGPGDDHDPLDSRWCCWSLRNALRSDDNFLVIYDGPGATIVARRAAPTGR